MSIYVLGSLITFIILLFYCATFDGGPDPDMLILVAFAVVLACIMWPFTLVVLTVAVVIRFVTKQINKE